MFIKRLIVRKTEPNIEIIRDIPFKLNGLNLIVDITDNIPQTSGNSVGKSTAVKIIDLCLGAKTPSYLYKDNETKTDNEKIKNFLEEYKVEAELILFNEKNHISIRRGLYKNGSRFIDDKPYKKDWS
ncbi:hypothetical protein BHF71_11260 [Vulcanibacillus modesticaldus]|uniref:DUF2326 domain-containing protein n=1 Tax=Vulcanibacillus modesticaldus TaxID=337097 RepID=A0A1D2YS68_9BACI|nr:hypothetical protein [Vulcanibacillus modesticaldus]OEF96895.1 hypothetical protein BHF71_11260 [Vulcanibacillus modesticaldus]